MVGAFAKAWTPRWAATFYYWSTVQASRSSACKRAYLRSAIPGPRCEQTHSSKIRYMYACMSSHLQCSIANCRPCSAI